MSVKFNPFTGQFDFTGAAAAGTGQNIFVQNGSPIISPPAGAAANDLCLDTATNNVYQYDGANWSLIGTLGAASTATDRTFLLMGA
jgi:hypothetical protein